MSAMGPLRQSAYLLGLVQVWQLDRRSPHLYFSSGNGMPDACGLDPQAGRHAARLALAVPHAALPLISEWVRHWAVTLAHATEMMEVWDINPLVDFKADLADILSMRWPSESMHSLKVTYPDLLAVGFSADTMHMFGYTMLARAIRAGDMLRLLG
eukprot:1925637-Rhodomonas_salina.2